MRHHVILWIMNLNKNIHTLLILPYWLDLAYINICHHLDKLHVFKLFITKIRINLSMRWFFKCQLTLVQRLRSAKIFHIFPIAQCLSWKLICRKLKTSSTWKLYRGQKNVIMRLKVVTWADLSCCTPSELCYSWCEPETCWLMLSDCKMFQSTHLTWISLVMKFIIWNLFTQLLGILVHLS